MVWSYSVGLTTGSSIAYSLNDWLGPKVDSCSPLDNVTDYGNGSNFVNSLTPDEVSTELTTSSSILFASSSTHPLDKDFSSVSSMLSTVAASTVQHLVASKI